MSSFPSGWMAVAATVAPVPVRFDHVCALLADHDDGCIGVATHNFWHDAGIDDSEASNAVNFEFVIDDGFRIVYIIDKNN